MSGQNLGAHDTHDAVPISDPPRFWSQEAYQALLTRIHTMTAPYGGAKVRLDSHWSSDVRWGRNRIIKAGDWRDMFVSINHCDCVGMSSNQADLGSIHGMVDWAETMTQRFSGALPDAVLMVMPHEGRPFP